MPGPQAVDLCDSALRLEGRERAAFLEEACAGDEALQREVESLLAWEQPAERFLTSPALELLTAPGAPAEPERLPAGLEIGPYRIEAHLGGGGMGQVYQARDARLGRDVAMKFLPAASAQDPEALKRFQREARAASALNHPNICTLHDIGEHDGQPFLVMELLEGQSLKERLQAGPLPPGEVLDLALQITGALEAAHSKGIVHRDIKPANIFLKAPRRQPMRAEGGGGRTHLCPWMCSSSTIRRRSGRSCSEF
jgi:serine/threonine protein kinase